jgi:hypothetical protein
MQRNPVDLRCASSSSAEETEKLVAVIACDYSLNIGLTHVGGTDEAAIAPQRRNQTAGRI